MVRIVLTRRCDTPWRRALGSMSAPMARFTPARSEPRLDPLHRMLTLLRLCLLLGRSGCAAAPADSYPDRSIHLIVAVSAGRAGRRGGGVVGPRSSAVASGESVDIENHQRRRRCRRQRVRR
jgi:hypothetical protein